MKSSGPQGSSSIRFVLAGVCLLAALVILPIGFVQMVRALEHDTSVNYSFVWLGAGGALLGCGIVLWIWEMSVRFNVRH